jgi:hypothetical protein
MHYGAYASRVLYTPRLRARLSRRRAEDLFAACTGRPLHQLRHSALTHASRRARRPPSHGRVGTPSPPPELCDYHAAGARPFATTSKPAQNIQIRRGEVTGHRNSRDVQVRGYFSTARSSAEYRA